MSNDLYTKSRTFTDKGWFLLDIVEDYRNKIYHIILMSPSGIMYRLNYSRLESNNYSFYYRLSSVIQIKKWEAQINET